MKTATRQVVVVLQARTNSSRLPGKALMPLAGYESAVLAALRAGNTGLNVILATSDQPSDDRLTEAARRRGLTVFRGDLDDVRSRFEVISRNLAPDDVLVRLTADNVFPDGELIQSAISSLLATGLPIARSMEDPHVPYGLSVEAFRVSTFRRSLHVLDDEVAEHVTPPIIATQVHFPRFLPLERDYSALRCTLDTDEDYQRLTKVFSEIHDPTTARWTSLVEKLQLLE